jgi:predicted DCC family thiol-disulfide oxidoreductase YuxK
VNFVIDRDPGGFFRFASLQSEMGQRVLTQHGLSEKYLDSIVLVEIECPIKPC